MNLSGNEFSMLLIRTTSMKCDYAEFVGAVLRSVTLSGTIMLTHSMFSDLSLLDA